MQIFLTEVNVLWAEVLQNETFPIDWLYFTDEDKLLEAYYNDPLEIPISVIFGPSGPRSGSLTYVL